MTLLKNFIDFIKNIWASKAMLLSLSVNDIKTKYAGSVLGILWSFIQPTVTMFVLFVVYQIGFRSMPVSNVPFILWLMAGYIPWIYFSDGLSSATSCLYEYSYLVKKIKFRTSLLPIVKVLSATMVHLFFLLLLFVLFTLFGRGFSINYFHVFFFLACEMFLLVGLAWLTSSLSAFFKDFAQVINVILQIAFWASPILWDYTTMSSKVLFILKLNPLFYIIQGYRDVFVYGAPFYGNVRQLLYFGAVSVAIFCAGAFSFQRLRPHFADVL